MLTDVPTLVYTPSPIFVLERKPETGRHHRRLLNTDRVDVTQCLRAADTHVFLLTVEMQAFSKSPEGQWRNTMLWNRRSDKGGLLWRNGDGM